MKNKILFIGRFSPPVHGAAVMNQNYLDGLKTKKEFIVEGIKVNYSTTIADIGGISIMKFVGIFITFFRLLVSLLVFRPNLVYFEIAPNRLAFYRDSLFVILCKIFRRKIIFQIHARNLVKNRYSKFILKNTKMIILSNMLFDEVGKLFDKKEVYVLPNGIKDELSNGEFEDILRKRKNNKVLNVLFLSNMIESKGAMDALKMCKMIDGKIKFKCYFAGPWQNEVYKKKWFDYIDKNGLKDECTYLGPKYGKDKKELLSKTDIMLFPSKYENESFPLVILEAFMYGIPVLTYDNGAISEMVSKNYLGVVVEKGDWNTLSKRIDFKFDSKKIREHFLKNYELNKAVNKLTKIIRKEL